MSRPRSREAAKDFDENLVASEVVDAALEIHRELGPGLLESVYEIVLADELSRRGIPTERQVPVPISYKGRKFLEAFRADLIAAGKVCVEIKSVEAFSKSDPKQLRTYLRLLNLRIGLLLNFNAPLLKDGIKRIVNGLENDPYRRTSADKENLPPFQPTQPFQPSRLRAFAGNTPE